MSMRQKLAAIVFAAVTVFIPAVPAFAQYPGTPPPSVLPSDTTKPEPTVEVKGQKEVKGVAVTGADVAGLAALGGIAVVGGTLIRRASRRSS